MLLTVCGHQGSVVGTFFKNRLSLTEFFVGEIRDQAPCCHARFQGRRPRSDAIMQMSLTPAKTSPAPTKAVAAKK